MAYARWYLGHARFIGLPPPDLVWFHPVQGQQRETHHLFLVRHRVYEVATEHSPKTLLPCYAIHDLGAKITANEAAVPHGILNADHELVITEHGDCAREYGGREEGNAVIQGISVYRLCALCMSMGTLCSGRRNSQLSVQYRVTG